MEFDSLAASTPSCAERYREHLLAHLLCPGRHTVTSLITAHGGQFADWTAHYDLYAQGRVAPQALFRGVLSHVEALNGDQEPLTVALDDTILRKSGKHIPGAAYRKDPLGPPFNINLVWAQRMIQFSTALPNPDGQVRMIPIDFVDASPRPNKSVRIPLFRGRKSKPLLQGKRELSISRPSSESGGERLGISI